ncbi:MBL fold metallo-hydrolase [Neobacillus sp. OS1-2]|uniref:MBL fold metallo-hydrolase n=1 Tax=Neobacillus sp. OS1-2 TaxID=3070680 RepID=UPI0027DFD039|nr:MBL fold metallo-hydrolase [Neobacillus sp. OS1-2]WML39922.1 MBL fold metallo-hydrolase [Neobacillus sp. OS1-2]
MKTGNECKVIRVPIPTPTLLPHTTTNCYLIGNKHESILVDAGYDQPATKIVLQRVMKENGLALPKSIILTHSHPDHAPGVLQLVDWKPVVYCHRQEEQATLAAVAPWDQLSFFEDGDRISIAGEEIIIFHAPGHTAGQLNLYISSKQILLTGDNIVAEGTSWIGPPDGNMSDYLQTLKRLKQLKLNKIGPGHGEWVENPHEHIDFVLGRRFYRENQIKSLLEEHGSLTVVHLTNLIYDKLPHPNVFEVAKRTTEAHLIKLMKDDTVIMDDSYFSLK